MNHYIREYLQNTILFFIITLIWNLVEGSPLDWIQMFGQALIFGVIITLVTTWYSRRRKKREE